MFDFIFKKLAIILEQIKNIKNNINEKDKIAKKLYFRSENIFDSLFSALNWEVNLVKTKEREFDKEVNIKKIDKSDTNLP